MASPRNFVRVALALVLAAASPARAAAADLVVYDDALQNGFQDWSWATHSLTEATTRHSGTYAISMHAVAWSGLYFHLDGGFAAHASDTLEFWVNGGSAAGKSLGVSLVLQGVTWGDTSIDPFVEGGIVPTTWARVRVPFAALGVGDQPLDGFYLMAWSNADQGTVYFDDLVVRRGAAAPPPPHVAVAVDPSLDRRPIADAIYGVGFGSATDFAAAPYPFRRWGGNSTTRYSWLADTHNTGSDWFYFNIVDENAHPENLPDGSSLDRFVTETRAAGARPLVTLPTIGWTPKDRQKRWGFSVAKYGAQQQTECTATGGTSWCTADAGNGVLANGSNVSGNDPHDTSAPFSPADLAPWISHLDSLPGGVHDYALDNECMLWHSTHRDVHPGKVTYDELWSRTVQYAGAIKAADPAAKVWGPVTWGWCDLWTSAADDCVSGADRAAHGGMPLLEWYLAQLGAWEQAHGERLVDVLDLHWYPQADRVALSSDETSAVSAVRLRSVKELYDPTYASESWIGQPVYLVPRVRAWIAAHAPWVQLAITEYNWGDDDGLSSALAQAEVLAVFGREGVDAAARWVAPAAGSRMVDAFRLFLDYDGAGSRVAGESVRATSTDVDRVGAYAVRASGADLDVLLFNKSTAPETVSVAVAGGVGGNVALYRFDATQSLGPAGSVAPSGEGFTLVLPARSATLAVTAAVVDVGPAAEGALRFEGAWPNPVRGQGTLRFFLPSPATASLELFDLAGRRVRTLARDRAFGGGRQELGWDGRDERGARVPGGVYFARLRVAGEAAIQRTVVLVR